MIYTIDNPKLVKDYYSFKGRENFTGVVKDKGGDIVYFLNGKLHREDEPACEYADGTKQWWLNGKAYGINDDYTNKSWKRFVRLELLK